MHYTFRTSPPPGYISPSTEEMREVAERVGLKSYSRDLVADMANLAAGGKFNPPSSYRSHVQTKVEQNLEVSDEDGEWKISYPIKGRQWTKNREIAVRDRTDNAMRYHQSVIDFLNSLDLARFPGATPLEQAMGVLKLLSAQKGGSGGGEGGEPLPIFVDNDNPEKVSRDLNEVLDEVESLSAEEMDLLDPDGKMHTISEDGNRTGIKDLQVLKVAEDLSPGKDKRVLLDVARLLEDITKLQLRKQEKFVADPAGDEIRHRQMNHMGELPKIPRHMWAQHKLQRTQFLYKAVTNQLPIRERGVKQVRRQIVWILLDGSGSMYGSRHWKASGIVMFYLKQAMEGNAIVYLSVFDTEATKAEHAETPVEARELSKKFMGGNYRGGGTDIAKAVKTAHDEIQELMAQGALVHSPQVIVLTDDDSSAKNLSVSDIPGTVVHGFAMESKNPSLVAKVKETGGFGIENF